MALKIVTNLPGRCVKSPHGSSFLNLGLFKILLGRSFTQQLSDHAEKMKNAAQLHNPDVLGMDVREISKQHSSIVKHTIDKERLEKFMLEKGANQLIVESIISRYPRAISCRSKDLAEVWEIWKTFLETDEAIMTIVKRSPESFFRSGGVDKLSENISFFQSLGLSPKLLTRLFLKSPRTFCYSNQHHKQMAAFLQELCVRLGDEDPEKFVIQVVANNIYIFTKSLKNVQANIETLQSLMKLENKDLLPLFQGKGALLFNLRNIYIEGQFLYFQQKMQSLGFLEAECTYYIYKNPNVLLLSPKLFTQKVDLLLDCGVEPRKIFDVRQLLDGSLESMSVKVKLLKQLGFDFKKNRPSIIRTNIKILESMLKKASQSNTSDTSLQEDEKRD